MVPKWEWHGGTEKNSLPEHLRAVASDTVTIHKNPSNCFKDNEAVLSHNYRPIKVCWK